MRYVHSIKGKKRDKLWKYIEAGEMNTNFDIKPDKQKL